MIKRFLALVVSLVLCGLDLVRDWVLRRLGRPLPRRGVVLYYHAVKPRQRSRFARQMDEILKRARPFPAGTPQAVAGGARSVAITFDDGFRSVVENAAPELAKRRIPFTLFVPSGSLGERPSWVRDPKHPSWDERVLTIKELRALASTRLATIGSHAVTHRNLLRLDPAEARREMAQSRVELKAALGSDVDLFSFPHGAHSPEHLDHARQAGYRHVFTIEPANVGEKPDDFVIGRVAVDPEDWPLEFRLKIAGAYRWRCWLHRLTAFYRH